MPICTWKMIGNGINASGVNDNVVYTATLTGANVYFARVTSREGFPAAGVFVDGSRYGGDYAYYPGTQRKEWVSCQDGSIQSSESPSPFKNPDGSVIAPPPSASTCDCSAEIERVYTRVDYVYTKVDYALNELSVITSNIDALMAAVGTSSGSTSNPVVVGFQDIVTKLNAYKESNLSKIQSAADTLSQKIQDATDDVVKRWQDELQSNQHLASLGSGIQTNQASINDVKDNVMLQQQSLDGLAGGVTGLKGAIDILKDIADGIDDKVDDLKEPEYVDEYVTLGGMVNSGQLALSPVAVKAFLTNLSMPNGIGRRFSRIANQPDNLEFGYIWFKFADSFSLESPIEWKKSVFDVPKGATHLCYWLLPSVTFEAKVLEKIEVTNL